MNWVRLLTSAAAVFRKRPKTHQPMETTLQNTRCLAPLLVIMVVHAAISVAGAELQTVIRPAPDDALFSRTTIPEIEIEIPEAGLDVLRRYNWREVSDEFPREDVQATVREGSAVYTNVAVHLKGSAGSFRPIDSEKPALTLNFDKFAKGQRFHGLQKVYLNNSVQDPSYISEIICRELFAKAGVPSPRASYLLARLNGRPSELYVLVEGWNKQFLKRHFENAAGNLYDGGFAKDITYPIEAQSGENQKDRSRLDELVAAAREPNPAERTRRLAGVLDVDQFLTFLAMEILTVHWDGYGMNRNNYRVFHDLDSNRILFLPHGMDQMFGQWRSRPESPITPMMKGIVAKAVMSNPQLRKRYLERMGVLLTNVFDYAAISNRTQELTHRIQPHLLKNLNALANQELSANAFCDRVERRMRSVRQQLADASRPLEFNAAGVAVLSGWRPSREAGNPGFPGSSRTTDTLKVSAQNGYAYGSWRTFVLLEPGHYEFTGRVRTDNLSTNNGVTRGGVSLRISGEREPAMIIDSPEWKTLRYEFDVNGLLDIELVCEFRASGGSAEFDRASLRLIHTAPAE